MNKTPRMSAAAPRVVAPLAIALFVAGALALRAVEVSPGGEGGRAQTGGAVEDAKSALGLQADAGAPAPAAPAISGGEGLLVFKLAGDGQRAPAGQWGAASLEVGVWRENGPEPLINVPVDFSLASGGGWLAATPGFDAGLQVRILTDADGVAQVWHRQPDRAGVTSLIAASALGKSVTFTTYSIAAEPSVSPAPSAPGAGSVPAQTQPSPPVPAALGETTTAARPARPTQKEMLMALATAQGTRRAGAQASKSVRLAQGVDEAPENTPGPATKSVLPDEYFAHPAGHPLGRMERGMVLYAASGRARELRDTEQAVLLAAESGEWLALALESEGGLDDASVSRCHYYLGKLKERYGGDRAEILRHYRASAEKDATRWQAKAAAVRVGPAKKPDASDNVPPPFKNAPGPR